MAQRSPDLPGFFLKEKPANPRVTIYDPYSNSLAEEAAKYAGKSISAVYGEAMRFYMERVIRAPKYKLLVERLNEVGLLPIPDEEIIPKFNKESAKMATSIVPEGAYLVGTGMEVPANKRSPARRFHAATMAAADNLLFTDYVKQCDEAGFGAAKENRQWDLRDGYAKLFDKDGNDITADHAAGETRKTRDPNYVKPEPKAKKAPKAKGAAVAEEPEVHTWPEGEYERAVDYLVNEEGMVRDEAETMVLQTSPDDFYLTFESFERTVEGDGGEEIEGVE